MNDIVVGDVTRGWFPFCFAVHDIKKIVSGYYRADLFRARSCVCDSLLPRAFDGKKKHIFQSNSLRKIFKGSNQAKRCDNHREKDFQKMYY